MFDKLLKMLGTSRPMKNTAGAAQGFGSCPNCGDSWAWKESGSITYKQESDDISLGVMICKECLADSAGLSTDRISLSLRILGWPYSEIELAIKAVEAYKNRGN